MKRYGARLSIMWKSIATYAVWASKCDGSIFRMVPHVGRPVRFFVTSFQCAPASVVFHSLPSFVPAQMSPFCISDGAIANTTSP